MWAATPAHSRSSSLALRGLRHREKQHTRSACTPRQYHGHRQHCRARPNGVRIAAAEVHWHTKGLCHGAELFDYQPRGHPRGDVHADEHQHAPVSEALHEVGSRQAIDAAKGEEAHEHGPTTHPTLLHHEGQPSLSGEQLFLQHRPQRGHSNCTSSLYESNHPLRGRSCQGRCLACGADPRGRPSGHEAPCALLLEAEDDGGGRDDDYQDILKPGVRLVEQEP
mmetsp:Transcript_87041/g.280981  ORF Transcript_87041/g.280981 Transcript_87041/m.280981 type:complete len:223 (+) Transcript_87041:71-739(+)